ncbi:hypothetical protein J6590_013872 [Homalodisca vitripennis]|nr:hypothetical protein J6590_013872 [Homalodisca vitripennis]
MGLKLSKDPCRPCGSRCGREECPESLQDQRDAIFSDKFNFKQEALNTLSEKNPAAWRVKVTSGDPRDINGCGPLPPQDQAGWPGYLWPLRHMLSVCQNKLHHTRKLVDSFDLPSSSS